MFKFQSIKNGLIVISSLIFIAFFVFLTFKFSPETNISAITNNKDNRIGFYENNNGGIILVSSVDEDTYICDYNNDINSYKVDNFKCICAHKIDDYLYLFANTPLEKTIKVKCYSIIDKNIISEKDFKGFKISAQDEITILNNGEIFLLNPSCKSEIINLSTGKKQPFKNSFISIKSDITGDLLYTLTDNEQKSIIIDKDLKSKKSIDIGLSVDYKFLNDDSIIDIQNNIFIKSKNAKYKFGKIFNIENIVDYRLSCQVGEEIIYVSNDHKINVLNLNDNNIIASLEIENEISYIYNFNDTIVYVTEGKEGINVNRVLLDDIKNPKDSLASVDVSLSEEDEEELDVNFLSIDEKILHNQDSLIAQLQNSNSRYNFNFDAYEITGIEPETNIAQFKNNVNYNGYKLKFTSPDSKVMQRGRLKTGTTVEFIKNGEIVNSFTCIVSGDVSGSGNINSNSIKKVFGYLLGKEELEEKYIKAGDINKDGILDTLDLLLLKNRMSSS